MSPPPARELVRRALGRPRIVRRADGAPRAVALTFDDGPSRWTEQIAGALEEHGCRGTFFMLGSEVELHPEVASRLARAGHELGNHLWSHTDPERLGRSALRDELRRTAAAITGAAGTRPALLRPPYCGAPRKVAWAARGTGVDLVVLRSVDPEDWRAPSAGEIADSVLSEAGPGDIVCLHDGVPGNSTGTSTRDATATAVARLVPELIARDLRPVTVSELLA